MLDKSFNFIKKIKRNFFPFYKNKEIQFVFSKLQEGYPNETITARFVGGCVRKYLSNDEIDDIDIATILSSVEIKEKFENTKFKVVDTGIRHGTITLVYKNLKIELTSLRKDLKTDGRHAEVEYIAINDLIARANVIDVTKIENNGKVIFGSTVKLQDLETEKQINYKLVGQDEADIKKNLIFFKSPIGKALIGKDKGEMVTVNTPSGDKSFEILDVQYI